MMHTQNSEGKPAAGSRAAPAARVPACCTPLCLPTRLPVLLAGAGPGGLLPPMKLRYEI